MPIEPNVLNYFVVVLGGFGIVWSFRHFSGRNQKRIGEFEYAAFSTLWGILVVGSVVWMLRNNPTLPNIVNITYQAPMVATPILFLWGVFLGWLAAYLELVTKRIRHKFIQLIERIAKSRIKSHKK